MIMIIMPWCQDRDTGIRTIHEGHPAFRTSGDTPNIRLCYIMLHCIILCYTVVYYVIYYNITY